MSTSPSDSCSKFNFKSLPSYHLVLTGKEAVNFVILRDLLERRLGCFAVDKDKIRLVFGVIDLIPLETFDRRRAQGESFGFLEGLSIFKVGLMQLFKKVSSHHEGIEFRFGSEAIDIILNMIKDVIATQGKDPEYIHIWIYFWLSEDDDGHNSDYDDDDELHGDEIDDDDGGYEKTLEYQSPKKEYPYSGKFSFYSLFRSSMRDFILRCSNSSGVSRRSYSTGSNRGGDDNKYLTGCSHENNSIDVRFDGVNVVDSNFVLKELGAVLLSELRYNCHVHITSIINHIPLCKKLERICIKTGYNIKEIKCMINDLIIPHLKFYDYKPERVDVVFSLFVWSQAEMQEYEDTLRRIIMLSLDLVNYVKIVKIYLDCLQILQIYG